MRRTIERRPRRVQRTSFTTRARARFPASYHVGRFPMESWVHVGSREGPLHADREYACRATARRPIDSPLFRESRTAAFGGKSGSLERSAIPSSQLVSASRTRDKNQSFRGITERSLSRFWPNAAVDRWAAASLFVSSASVFASRLGAKIALIRDRDRMRIGAV